MRELEQAVVNPLRPDQVASIEAAIEDSKSPGTRRAYSSAMRTFSAWCAANGQPHLPTSPSVVAAFLTERANAGFSFSTLTVALAAIRDAHLAGGHRDPTAHRGVTTVMAGLRRRLGTATRRQAHALSTGELRRILAGIERTTTVGKRDAAILIFGLASAMRRSEIVALRRADLQLSTEGILIKIRRSKGDQTGAGVTIGVPRGDHQDTDPVRAIRQWLGVRGGGPDDPVFTRVSRTGIVLAGGLTGQSINAVLQRRAADAGLDVPGISAHGLRAGHVTEALRGGARLEAVQRITRHKKLETLLGYAHTVNAIAESSAGALGL